MKCPDCGQENLAGEENCAACHASLSPSTGRAPAQGMRKKIMSGSVSDLPLHEAAHVSPEASVADAVLRMREHKMGCVLVARDGALAGLLTERSLLLKTRPGQDLSKIKVQEAMLADVDCLKEDSPVAFAFHKMSIQGHYHLPVRRKNGSLAVVSARDVLAFLCV